MYIYIYIYTHSYVYVCVYIYIYIYICVRLNMVGVFSKGHIILYYTMVYDYCWSMFQRIISYYSWSISQRIILYYIIYTRTYYTMVGVNMVLAEYHQSTRR